MISLLIYEEDTRTNMEVDFNVAKVGHRKHSSCLEITNVAMEMVTPFSKGEEPTTKW
jgi:hypothetical protein